MKPKIFKYKWFNKTFKVFLVLTKYVADQSLAVLLIEDKSYEEFADVSKHLPNHTPNEGCFFVDTNNLPGVEDFLEENHIAFPTGRKEDSGFCTYPEYRLNEEVISLCHIIG